MKKNFGKEFRAKVALETLHGEKTLAELSSEYGVHANVIGQWKNFCLKMSANCLKVSVKNVTRPEIMKNQWIYFIARLGKSRWRTTGLKKIRFFRREQRISMIDHDNKDFSVREQCRILGINRFGLYYEVRLIAKETLKIMRLLDEERTKHPFYGAPKMTEFLRRKDYKVGRDRVRTLLRSMGLEAVYPKPKASIKSKDYKIYPYLLKDVEVIRPNQVWSADITYIRLEEGFVYLVAIVDWYSRYLISWRVSNTMDTNFCVEVLEEALKYAKPEIFNTDQGSQFTSMVFTRILKKSGISISMDAKGRVFDNIFIERLWRTVKYENIYIKDYKTIPDLKTGLAEYFDFYNGERYHQNLNYKTPWGVYIGEQASIELKLLTKKKKNSKKERKITAVITI